MLANMKLLFHQKGLPRTESTRTCKKWSRPKTSCQPFLTTSNKISSPSQALLITKAAKAYTDQTCQLCKTKLVFTTTRAESSQTTSPSTVARVASKIITKFHSVPWTWRPKSRSFSPKWVQKLSNPICRLILLRRQCSLRWRPPKLMLQSTK